MILNLLLPYIVYPVVLGAALSLFWIQTGKFGHIAGAMMITGLSLLYFYSLGWVWNGPAFPPVSAKDKLAYLIVLCGLFPLILGRLGPRVTAGVVLLFLSASYYWLAHRKLGVHMAPEDLFLPILSILIISFVAGIQTSSSYAELHWPATLIFVTTAGALTMATGGFISLGQFFGSMSALLAGALSVVGYTVLILTRRGTGRFLNTVMMGITPMIGVCLLAFASFATNLSQASFLLLLITLLTPLLTRQMVLDRDGEFRSVVAIGVAALPAALGSILAILNF